MNAEKLIDNYQDVTQEIKRHGITSMSFLQNNTDQLEVIYSYRIDSDEKSEHNGFQDYLANLLFEQSFDDVQDDLFINEKNSELVSHHDEDDLLHYITSDKTQLSAEEKEALENLIITISSTNALKADSKSDDDISIASNEKQSLFEEKEEEAGKRKRQERTPTNSPSVSPEKSRIRSSSRGSLDERLETDEHDLFTRLSDNSSKSL